MNSSSNPKVNSMVSKTSSAAKAPTSNVGGTHPDLPLSRPATEQPQQHSSNASFLTQRRNNETLRSLLAKKQQKRNISSSASVGAERSFQLQQSSKSPSVSDQTRQPPQRSLSAPKQRNTEAVDQLSVSACRKAAIVRGDYRKLSSRRQEMFRPASVTITSNCNSGDDGSTNKTKPEAVGPLSHLSAAQRLRASRDKETGQINNKTTTDNTTVQAALESGRKSHSSQTLQRIQSARRYRTASAATTPEDTKAIGPPSDTIVQSTPKTSSLTFRLSEELAKGVQAKAVTMEKKLKQSRIEAVRSQMLTKRNDAKAIVHSAQNGQPTSPTKMKNTPTSIASSKQLTSLNKSKSADFSNNRIAATSSSSSSQHRCTVDSLEGQSSLQPKASLSWQERKSKAKALVMRRAIVVHATNPSTMPCSGATNPDNVPTCFSCDDALLEQNTAPTKTSNPPLLMSVQLNLCDDRIHSNDSTVVDRMELVRANSSSSMPSIVVDSQDTSLLLLTDNDLAMEEDAVIPIVPPRLSTSPVKTSSTTTTAHFQSMDFRPLMEASKTAEVTMVVEPSWDSTKVLFNEYENPKGNTTNDMIMNNIFDVSDCISEGKKENNFPRVDLPLLRVNTHLVAMDTSGWPASPSQIGFTNSHRNTTTTTTATTTTTSTTPFEDKSTSTSIEQHDSNSIVNHDDDDDDDAENLLTNLGCSSSDYIDSEEPTIESDPSNKILTTPKEDRLREYESHDIDEDSSKNEEEEIENNAYESETNDDALIEYVSQLNDEEEKESMIVADKNDLEGICQDAEAARAYSNDSISTFDPETLVAADNLSHKSNSMQQLLLPPPPPPPPMGTKKKRCKSSTKNKCKAMIPLLAPPPPEKLKSWEESKHSNISFFNTNLGKDHDETIKSVGKDPVTHFASMECVNCLQLDGTDDQTRLDEVDGELSTESIISLPQYSTLITTDLQDVPRSEGVDSVKDMASSIENDVSQNDCKFSSADSKQDEIGTGYVLQRKNNGIFSPIHGQLDYISEPGPVVMIDVLNVNSQNDDIGPVFEDISFPFDTAVRLQPDIIPMILDFLGDPVAVCRMKMLSKTFCKSIESKEHRLMRDAVRLGGMNMNVRPYFWLWVTLEKCVSITSDPKQDLLVDNNDILSLERSGHEGKWHHVIERDVSRAFGNLPPHKTGARLRTDSIVRALVTWGRSRVVKRGVKGSVERQDSRSAEIDDNSNTTPTDTVSDWGGVTPVGSFSGSFGDTGSVDEDKRKTIKKGNSTRAEEELALSGNILTGEMKVALQGKLSFILNALAAKYPEVGYCQGMDYVVAHLLRILQDTVRWKATHGSLPAVIKSRPVRSRLMPPEEETMLQMHTDIYESLVVEEVCFRVMDSFFTAYSLQHFYWPELRCLKTCCRVFEKLVKIKLPVLADHFEHHDLNVGLFALGWFQTLFLYLPSMPSATVCHMWDIWLVERSFKIFFRVGTAILFLSQPILLNQELEGMMGYLNTFPDATLLSPDILIACALQIKVTNKMLMELEQEVKNNM